MKKIKIVRPGRPAFTVKVHTLDDYPDGISPEIGDLVDGEIIDYLRNNLPPVTDWGCLFQSGGPVCDRITADGEPLPAYHTFVTNPGVLPYWEYRGACLKGEQYERGEVPIWQRKV